MASAKARKRLTLFATGAAAWHAVGGAPDRYPCPLCGVEYTAADAESGQLTLEDVPPRAVGGKPLCLTCKPCNDRGGSLVDRALADLALMRQMHEAIHLKRGSFTGRVRATVDGAITNAVLRVDEGKIIIEADERRNAPGRVDAQIAQFRDYRPDRDGRPPTLHLRGRHRAGDRPVMVSILRAAYLVAFSTFGHRFAADESSGIVRAQIEDPTSVGPSWVILVDRDEEASRSASVGLLQAPAPGVVVYFPPNTLVYPRPVLVTLPSPISPPDFYGVLDRHSNEGEGGGRISLTPTAMRPWPRTPEYLWDTPPCDCASNPNDSST